jgi:hypothetical protein
VARVFFAKGQKIFLAAAKKGVAFGSVASPDILGASQGKVSFL